MNDLRLIFRYGKPYRRDLWAAAGLIFIECIFEMVIPVLMSTLVDEGVPSHNMAIILRQGGLPFIYPGHEDPITDGQQGGAESSQKKAAPEIVLLLVGAGAVQHTGGHSQQEKGQTAPPGGIPLHGAQNGEQFQTARPKAKSLAVGTGLNFLIPFVI